METPKISPPQENRARQWLRVLRPMLWWLLLVFTLYGIRTHQRLMEGTLLNFTVTLAGKTSPFQDASASLDGKPAMSGQPISLGKHQFIVTHPKGNQFQTNLFIWYGEHNLGNIDLKRTSGMLSVGAVPPAAIISIRGPEFALILTNSAGMTSSVPTDQYQIEASYPHWRQTQEIAVSQYLTGSVSIKPRFGTLQLSCNQTNVTFQILQKGGQLLQGGEFPAILSDVPEGDYKLVATHHRSREEENLSVTMGETNNIVIQFAYGVVELETEPVGATVRSLDGQEWGITPLRLEEVPVGQFQCTLVRNGYEPVSVTLQVVAGQTMRCQSNLVSLNYGTWFTAARQYLATANFERAFVAANSALEAKPGDADAQVVRKEALEKMSLQKAQALGALRNYAAGVKELEHAMQELPENENLKQLAAEFRNRRQEQVEVQRQERLERPKQLFEALEGRSPDSALFASHELKTDKPVGDARAAILTALKLHPSFFVTRNQSTGPETFEIEAQQELLTALSTKAGRRKCLIVGGQTRDTETQILFKVLEYKTEAVEKFSVGAWIGAPVDVTFVPIHPSRIAAMTDKLQAQLSQGVSNVTARIKGAIGQNIGYGQ